MKNYRFYLEYPSTYAKQARSGKDASLGTVVAVPLDTLRAARGDNVDCIGVIDTVAGTIGGAVCTLPWLRSHCKRISEAEARRIHPALFRYLDKTP